jgi:hypothetical protein
VTLLFDSKAVVFLLRTLGNPASGGTGAGSGSGVLRLRNQLSSNSHVLLFGARRNTTLRMIRGRLKNSPNTGSTIFETMIKNRTKGIRMNPNDLRVNFSAAHFILFIFRSCASYRYEPYFG